MLNDYLTVVIICYDPYNDALEINPIFFEKYWHHCCANVLYVSSFATIDSKYSTFKTSGDLSYHARLKLALNNTKTKYVLLLLDDYLIDKHVDEEKVLKDILFMEENNVHFCQLFSMFSTPRGKKVSFRESKYIRVRENYKYRINLQPAIFSKDLLLKLLDKKPFSAWDAEIELMKDSFTNYPAYFSLNKSFSVINYIEKGLVTRKAFKVLKRNNMWHSQRSVMSIKKTVKSFFVSKLYRHIPEKIKAKFKKDNKVFKV